MRDQESCRRKSCCHPDLTGAPRVPPGGRLPPKRVLEETSAGRAAAAAAPCLVCSGAPARNDSITSHKKKSRNVPFFRGNRAERFLRASHRETLKGPAQVGRELTLKGCPPSPPPPGRPRRSGCIVSIRREPSGHEERRWECSWQTNREQSAALL